jgi:hypothetical protein
VKYFQPPSGVVSIQIDPESGMPSTSQCPKTINEYFISGTEPVGSCPLHGGSSPDNTHISGWDAPQPGGPQTTSGQRPPAGKTSITPVNAQPSPGQPRAPSDSTVANDQGSGGSNGQPDAPDSSTQEPKKKKGFFGRIFKRN